VPGGKSAMSASHQPLASKVAVLGGWVFKRVRVCARVCVHVCVCVHAYACVSAFLHNLSMCACVSVYDYNIYTRV
jgi:hypothetical protein